MDSNAMNDGAEELAVEPHRMGRRSSRFLLAAFTALLAVILLTGDTDPPACGQSTDQPSELAGTPSWIAADDPLVRQVHYQVLDQTRTTKDDAPSGALPVDVRRSARRIGDVAGATVYLAAGPNFACLGADKVHVYDTRSDATSSVCLLYTTIVNQGLNLTITPQGSDVNVLLVVVPDGMQLTTGSNTVQLTAHPNFVALRPGSDPVLLQAPGRPPIMINTGLDEAIPTWSC